MRRAFSIMTWNKSIFLFYSACGTAYAYLNNVKSKLFPDNINTNTHTHEVAVEKTRACVCVCHILLVLLIGYETE